MFLVLIAVSFNAALLTFILSLILPLIIKPQHLMLWQVFIPCYLLVAGCAYAAFLPFGNNFVRYWCRWRAPDDVESKFWQQCLTEINALNVAAEIKLWVVKSP